jgi:ABC-type transporter Mla subunit MlaD
MKNERNNFKAGVFILLSVALIVTVIISINGLGRIFAPQQHRVVTFQLRDDLGGLQVGDEVRLGGFKVGIVENIDVRAENNPAAAATRPSTAPGGGGGTATPALLAVTFSLPERYVLREDCVIGVQSTVTGTACLNISDLGTGDPAPPELALVGHPSPLGSLFATLGGVAPDLKPIVADVRDVVGDVKARVVPKFGETLTAYKGAGEHLRDVLGDTKGDIRGTMTNLKEVTGTAKEKLPRTMDAAERLINRLDETVKNTEGTLTDLRDSMTNLRKVSEGLREVIGGNRGKLESMIASLKTTGDNLKAASSEIRHSPWRLLYKPGRGEMANLNLYDSARQFAEGAEDLNDAALALRDAVNDKDVKPEQVRELLGKLETSFTNFEQVEEKLWTSVQE